MKKIILSVAVATMALSTAAAALEDIKVTGQAKLWYETNNKDVAGTAAVAAVAATPAMANTTTGVVTPGTAAVAGKAAVPARSNGLFNKDGASGEVVFKLGITGKQGNVGFGATVYQTSTMGLENNLVSGDRTSTSNLDAGDNQAGQMYTSEMYITIPTIANTTLKIGKQELNTPLAFTEKWNATPNTFNAAVAINKSIENVTLVAAYVGQDSGSTHTGSEVDSAFYGGAYALVAHYKANGTAANAYYYNVGNTTDAAWVDASAKVGPVNAKVIATKIMPKGAAEGQNDTTAFGISAATKVAGFNVMAAYSTVSDDGYFAAGNTATNFKKTKLPTAGVYTDGLYVAQPGSNAFKVKASGKVAGVGMALQYVDNSNDNVDAYKIGHNKFEAQTLNTQEIDLILSKKLGDVNMKAIVLNRSFDDAATDTKSGGTHVRVIASVNF